jgi:UDP-N-acetylmuramate--alanine ligase
MKVHFVGVGGIGMSGLARLLLEQHHAVSGSDPSDNKILQRLRALGGTIYLKHEAANVKAAQIVAYSSSITPDNPELLAARNGGIPVIHRSEMVNRIIDGKKVVAVAGAHGKSTTTALASELLVAAGLDPTVILGAELDSLGGNARLGRGRWAVVEADESDASFLRLRPHAAIVTNVDDEHLDFYRNSGEIWEAYELFGSRVRKEGFLVGCTDDANVRRLFGHGPHRFISYGIAREAQIMARDVELGPGWSRFRCTRGGKSLGTVKLQVPGIHNVSNSLGLIGLSQGLGIDFKIAKKVLEAFQGTKRRFQIQGDACGVLVVEDYAHHPAEIESTLQAARQWEGRRVRVVFQPHRFSRTRFLMDRFATCFKLADEVLLLPIYSASEEPVEGVTSESMLEAVRRGGHHNVSLRSADEALAQLSSDAAAGDTILFLGAGSVGALAGRLAEELRRRAAANKEVAQHAA